MVLWQLTCIQVSSYYNNHDTYLLIQFPLQIIGWVKTDMGGPKAPLEIETSCESMVETITKMDKSVNGGFIQWDGKTLPW